MKFLLAAPNAKYIHSNPALYSLRAYAEKYHPEAAAQVELAEYTINQTVEEILADLDDLNRQMTESLAELHKMLGGAQND